jgi:hypothetical protein
LTVDHLTGLGSDFVIIDDPISTAGARDPKARLQLHQQFNDNISQRLNNDGAIVVVMQRLYLCRNIGYLVGVSGGTPIESDVDFMSPWVKFFLGFLGISDVEVIAADGEEKIEAAKTKIKILTT